MERKSNNTFLGLSCCHRATHSGVAAFFQTTSLRDLDWRRATLQLIGFALFEGGSWIILKINSDMEQDETH